MKYPIDNVTLYDLEVFPNYFLAGFMRPDGEIYQYGFVNDGHVGDTNLNRFLRWIKRDGAPLAGFNSSRYDDPVLTAFLMENSPTTAYNLGKDLIDRTKSPWDVKNEINSIDLMPLLPNWIGLKKVGVCLGHAKLQELPIDPHRSPNLQEIEMIREYNKNDLRITGALLQHLLPDLTLRAEMSKQYDVDLRSLGDATMAEKILMAEFKRNGGQENKQQLNKIAFETIQKNTDIRIFRPSWWLSEYEIMRTCPEMRKIWGIGNRLFETPITTSTNGRIPKDVLSQIVYLGDRYYKMGAGGLHSIDGPGVWQPEKDEVLVDIDVASYYPNIAITQKLHPRHWGDRFLPIYKDLVTRRLQAKAAGDKPTAYSLKIAVNGVFGKSSDPYSALYDPQMTANITVLGQLGLLILIAMLGNTGRVVSANTDGLSVLAKKSLYPRVKEIVGDWERLTGLVMEYTEYESFYQRDVNNYIAKTTKGKIKAKGRFVSEWPDLRHTPNANIVATAITAYLEHGTSFSTTLYTCHDINQFVLTQSVSSSWSTSWNGRPLGKMLRFYKSNSKQATSIIRTPGPNDKGNRGNVPNSEFCIPLEDLPSEFPEDLNFAWYLKEMEDLWKSISVPKVVGNNAYAELLHKLGFRPCLINPGASPSRAKVKHGETDFSSVVPPNRTLGTGTGDGLLAVLRQNSPDQFFEVSRKYPSKSRELIYKKQGVRVFYGARVPIPDGLPRVLIEGDAIPEKDGPAISIYREVEGVEGFDRFFTPAELKKARK